MALACSLLVLGATLLTLGGAAVVGAASPPDRGRRWPHARWAAWAGITVAAAWLVGIMVMVPGAVAPGCRVPLAAGVVLLAGLALRYTPELLAVRGVAAVLLLAARPALAAGADAVDSPVVRLDHGMVYTVIVLALCAVARPWLVPNLGEWLNARRKRACTVGWVLIAAGIGFCFLALTQGFAAGR